MMNDTDKEFIRQLDLDVERRLKLWIISAVLAQVIALAPVIFFLGGIYSDGRAAVAMLREQKTELSQRAGWMKEREQWEMSIEMWAQDKGFKPPKYKRDDR